MGKIGLRPRGLAACRLVGLAFAVAVLSAMKPKDAAYRKTFSELHAFCRERRLAPALANRLRSFFRHGSRLEAATRYDVLLGRLSPRLRTEAANAMAPGLLSGVSYLRQSYAMGPSQPAGRPAGWPAGRASQPAGLPAGRPDSQEPICFIQKCMFCFMMLAGSQRHETLRF